MRRRDGVYDYEDYKSIIANCRKNIDVIEVQKSYQWVKKKRVPRRNTNDDSALSTFLLNPVVEAKFVKGSRNLFYKTDFDESYQELNFLMQKFNVNTIPPLSNTIPRGVKSSKKEGIVTKLVPLMPLNRREFWLNLPTSDNYIDLQTDGQIVTNNNE